MSQGATDVSVKRERWAQRFVAFAEKQRTQRGWVRLNRLAIHFARSRCPDDLESQPPSWADLWVMQGYSVLEADIRSGFFSPAKHLRYLHPAIGVARMTVERLDILRGITGDDRSAFDANAIACCWTSAELGAAWCDAHGLPALHERRGPKVKDDAFAVSYAAGFVAKQHSPWFAAREAVKNVEGLTGASEDAKIKRIYKKLLKELKTTGN
jgi:hypothetical protein